MPVGPVAFMLDLSHKIAWISEHFETGVIEVEFLHFGFEDALDLMEDGTEQPESP
jgi:hypothetical protein